MKSEVSVKITASADSMIKRMDKATEAAERLKAALEAINGTEIIINIESRSVKRPWYKFW
jgi:hypothetical protein